ncbi:MAG: hypothetical protein AB9883_05155 [Acidaminococcaceae bacterium]
MPNKAKIEAMQNEIAELRNNLAELIFEIDQNIFHESKYLEKEYMEKIGQLELKSFKTQCAILRIRRKIEIVKELIDNNRYLDLEFVEKILDVDFEEYTTMLQEQTNLMKLALTQTKLFTLSAAEENELCKIYKELINALHPDLNLQQAEAATELYNEAVAAFSKKDLTALQKVMEKSLCLKSPVSVITDSALLLETKTTLEKITKDLREQQEFLLKSFPFVNINLLRDEDQLNAKIYELNEHINYYEAHLARFEGQLKELIISKTN